MANQTKRKSFILHKDSLDILDKLTDEQAGKLFKAIKFYQKNNETPKLDLTLDLVFTPFLNQFIRDDKEYKKVCEARKKAGSIGGKQKVANASKCKQKVANLADSDSKSKSKSEIKSEIKIDNKHIYQELSDGLKFILEEKLKRKIKATNWREDIRLLIENDLKPRSNAIDDVKKAIQAVSDHYGKEYFPVIQSAGSLKKKFSSIENYLARNSQKDLSYFDLQNINLEE